MRGIPGAVETGHPVEHGSGGERARLDGVEPAVDGAASSEEL